jgi:hypothetical protein
MSCTDFLCVCSQAAGVAACLLANDFVAEENVNFNVLKELSTVANGAEAVKSKRFRTIQSLPNPSNVSIAERVRVVANFITRKYHIDPACMRAVVRTGAFSFDSFVSAVCAYICNDSACNAWMRIWDREYRNSDDQMLECVDEVCEGNGRSLFEAIFNGRMPRSCVDLIINQSWSVQQTIAINLIIEF